MRILLYGGSFDPPHNGHMNNLRAAAARVKPDKVVVMPAGVSPFKRGTCASGALRMEMCRCFSALAEEQAVPALAAEYPGAALYLAIGSDMLLTFDGWHRWQDILKLAHLVVTSRNIGDDPVLHEKAKRLDAAGARILFAPVEALPMASSDLRARLAAGDRCENELPPLVRRVIQREGLYRENKGDNNHEPETGKGACAQPLE